MGHWKPQETIYGTRELWVPDHPGDWPEDSGEPLASLGVLPECCPGCVGQLWRWKVTNQFRIQSGHERAMRRWTQAGRPGPEPKPEEPWERLRYDLYHDRLCTGQEKRYEPKGDDVLELRPHVRADEY